MVNYDYEERKDWGKADRICRLSLQKECDLLRAYRRSIGHVDKSNLEKLKQEWLEAKRQHNENIQTWWDSLFAPWLRTKKDNSYEHAHKCPFCEHLFYSRHRATVYCCNWCMYTVNKRKRVERYLKALDIPGLVAKRSRKKHVNTERPSYRNMESRDKSKAQAQND